MFSRQAVVQSNKRILLNETTPTHTQPQHLETQHSRYSPDTQPIRRDSPNTQQSVYSTIRIKTQQLHTQQNQLETQLMSIFKMKVNWCLSKQGPHRLRLPCIGTAGCNSCMCSCMFCGRRLVGRRPQLLRHPRLSDTSAPTSRAS